MDNNWRMSIPMLKTKIERHCKNCENWMGEEHDYSFCYKNKRGLELVCSDELKQRFPLYNEMFEKYSKEYQRQVKGILE